MPSLTENPGRTVVAAVIGLGSMGLRDGPVDEARWSRR